MYASTHADVPLSPEQRAAELARLDEALKGFTLQMREHLVRKLDAGWRGWDNPDNGREIWNAMLAHAAGVPLAKGQEVGIANFAMFLWVQRLQGSGSVADDAQRRSWGEGYSEGVERDRAAGIYRDTVPAATGINSELMISRMVDRFLGWPLPKDFAPDCGISFDGTGMTPEAYRDGAGYRRSWPVGTNLFTATQARQLFEFLLSGDDRPGC